jgi:parvulin-like peptidyl-prolyl isomerase
LEKVAFALKDGEISEPVDIPQALVFFQVTGHSHLDVKDVSPEIERNLKQERVNSTMADVKKNTTVWMDDQYFASPAKAAGAPSLGPPVLTTPKH